MLRTMEDVKSVDIRVTTEEDRALLGEHNWYDYSKTSDIAQCPTYGIVTHSLGKRMKGSGRQMALEAGSAAHEVFCASRILQLVDQGFIQHAEYHGMQLFGETRFEQMLEHLSTVDERKRRFDFCLEALYSSGFTDDDMDKKRTIGNIEETCMVYLDEYDYDRFPVWVSDPDDPTSMVGAENGIDIVVEFTFNNGEKYLIRWVGKVDGIHVDKKHNYIVLNENKTSGRLSDAWRNSFMTSHQLTGYCVAMSAITEQAIENVDVYGSCLPVPRSYTGSGAVTRIPEKRTQEDYYPEWLGWILFHTQVDKQYGTMEKVFDAPRNTHACNRYFSTCSLMPFCATPRQDRMGVLEDMEEHRWSPLAENA